MKLVLIKEEGRFFPFYKEWAYGISPKHADLYVMGSTPKKNRVYIAIISGYYFRNTNIPLTLIQDPITRQVYTIETNQLIDLTKGLEVGLQNNATNKLKRLKKFKEAFDNYILQLNERIKINKKIIEENFDLNPNLCRDLEVENTALEFALMLEVGPQNNTTTDTASMTIQEVVNMLERRIIYLEKELSRQTYGSQMIYRAIEINLLERRIDSFTDKFNLTDVTLYTTEDVQNLIDAITDEADELAGNLFDTMDLIEIERPIMAVFNKGDKK